VHKLEPTIPLHGKRKIVERIVYMSKKKAADGYYETLRMKGFKLKKELNKKFKELLNKKRIIKRVAD
jgi:hypothetical protein